MVVIDKVHPTTVSNLEATRDFGVAIGKLRYDILLDVLHGLQSELLRQRDGDAVRGRVKLAESLGVTAEKLSAMILSLEKTVAICRPYIEEEKKLSK